MTTTDRVEITPELLHVLECGAKSAAEKGWSTMRVNLSTVRALVARIRELESLLALADLPEPGEWSVTLEQVKDGDTRIRQYEDVRIFSGEHRLWWRQNGRGYTGRRVESGVYTMADAFDRTHHCGPEKHISFFPVDSRPS